MDKLITKYYNEVDPGNWQACGNALPGSNNCVDCFHKQYFDGNNISYDCEQKRKIYVLSYLPVHHKEVYLALSKVPKKVTTTIAGKKSIRILSIGSGPGSDILAFKKIILDGQIFLGDAKDILISMVEKVPSWDVISEEVLQLYNCNGLNYSYNRYHFDFGAKEMEKNFDFDYLLLSYVISEFKGNEIHTFTNNLQRCIGNPSVLIINDRNQESVIDKINQIVNEFKVNQIIKSCSEEWCGVAYPQNIKDKIKPKLTTKSIRYTVVVSL